MRSNAAYIFKTTLVFFVITSGIFKMTFVRVSNAGIDSTKMGSAIAQIELFGDSIAMFKNDTGRYPSTEEGLDALRHKPSMVNKWNGPYINKDIPLDPWGKRYIYIYPRQYGSKSYDLYSCGANMKDDLGEKDDITNWGEINNEYYNRHQNIKKFLAPSLLIILIAALLYWLLRKRGLRRGAAREKN